jgi:CRP-like cAMP-binding protein
VKPAPALELPPGLKCPLFEGISKPDLQSILREASRRRIAARTALLHAGDRAEAFYILLSGCAQIYTHTEHGQRVIMLRVEPGDVIGAAALLPGGNHHYLFDTEVIEASEVLEWRRGVIRSLMHKIPALADNVLLLAARFAQLGFSQRIAAVSQTAEQRLAAAILELSQNGTSGDATAVPVTNEQLADMVNASPFTVARILSEWNRSGIIRRRRGKIDVCSAEKLALYQNEL